MRELRIHYPGAVYHVMSRGVERRAIFLTDADRRMFLTYLIDVIRRHKLSVFAYCLMDNHFHMLIAVDETPLETAMKDLLSHYALHFNIAHERVGHLFQGRYTAIICQDLAYLIHLIAYIHLNPVRAGMAATPADWAWSSHDEFMRLSGPFLNLSQMKNLTGLEPSEARQRYIERIRSEDGEVRRDPTLRELVTRAAHLAGIDPAALISGKRGPAYTHAKLQLIRWATTEGFTDVEIAAELNCTPTAIYFLRKRRAG